MEHKTDTAGRIYGNYVVRGLLGEGGMGVVYAGEHRFLGDRVALKVLHGNFRGDNEVAQRFFHEAKAAREIDHPNVVRILDFGESGTGDLYLVMERLEGQSLAELLAEGALTEESAAFIGAEVADGLAAAHKKGIVHRDLKPANVFIAGEKVKLLDFGIAKIAAMQRTDTGVVLGTPAYMSPEQARGMKHVGPATDIYALGALLYEAVTGRMVFEEEDLRALYAQIFFKPAMKPSKLAAVSDEMEALIMQCLEKEVEPRPASMEEVRDRLRAIAGASFGARGIALRATDPRRTALDALHTTTMASSGEVFPRVLSRPPGRRRSQLLWALGGASALFALAVTLAALRIGGHPDSPRPAPTAVAPVKPPAPVVTPMTVPAANPPGALPLVVVRSEPTGAEVFVDDQPAGRTPAILHVALPHEVVLRHEGYHPAREVLSAPGEATIKLTPVRHAPLPRPPQPQPQQQQQQQRSLDAPPPARETLD